MDYGAPTKNLNKGYKSESVKTERSNLMNDNPVAKDASGGRSWMSKHSQSNMGGSPVKQYEDKGSPTEKHTDAQEKGLNPGMISAIHMHDDFTKKNNIKHK